MQDDLDPAYLRQIDAVAVELETLRIADRLRRVLLLEARVLRPVLEEVHVGPIKIHELLLQDLTIGFLQPSVIFAALETLEQSCRGVVVQSLAMLLVMIPPCSQCPVVDKPRMAELHGERVLLRRARIEAVEESLLNVHW